MGDKNKGFYLEGKFLKTEMNNQHTLDPNLAVYEDRLATRFLDNVCKSAKKRNLTISWVLIRRRSYISGKPYYQRTIAAVTNKLPYLRVGLNVRGSVSWYQLTTTDLKSCIWSLNDVIQI